MDDGTKINNYRDDIKRMGKAIAELYCLLLYVECVQSSDEAERTELKKNTTRNHKKART